MQSNVIDLVSGHRTRIRCRTGTPIVTDVSYGEATRLLVERDPVLAGFAVEAGPVAFRRDLGSNFEALVRAIVYQQLAGAAARAIYARLVAMLGRVEPEVLVTFSQPQLHGVGLSGAKALAVLDLAAKVIDGTVVLDETELLTMSDAELETQLVSVHGIGPWTAEVFMMIHLARLDILPVGDLGIRKGFALIWNMTEPSPKELLRLGEPFRPYRSVLSWYCWSALELRVGAKGSAVTGAAG